MSNIIVPDWVSKQWTHINTIDWTQNIVLPESAKFPENIQNEIDKFKRFIESIRSLEDLEKWLVSIYWEWWMVFADDIRIANSIWWKWTQIHRNAKSIIVPWTEMDWKEDTQHNIWNNVIDPIWFASRSMAPTVANWYGLLWKIPKLRPSHGKFNQEFYDKVMKSTTITISEILWYSIEINNDKVALMSVMKINWWEDFIMPFSEKLKSWDIQTAKHYVLNN